MLMPTLIKVGNLRVIVYPKDHPPPHVHVIGPVGEAKIDINNFDVIWSYGFSWRTLKKVELALRRNQHILLDGWEKYCEEEEKK